MNTDRSVLQERALRGVYSVAAVAVGLAISFAVIGVSGSPVGESFSLLFEGAFGSSSQLAATVARMVPLVLVGLGWIAAARCAIFNIGLDGQIIMGGVFATVIALYMHASAVVVLPLAMISGIVGGALWAGVAATLLARRHVNEIISTLMLNFIAMQVLGWLVSGPLKDPNQTRSQTETLPSETFLPHIGNSNVLKWDLALALLAVVALSLVLRRSAFGFRMRLVSANESAAHRAGVRTTRVRVQAFLVSGALAGLVGVSLVLGSRTHTTAEGFNAGYGFDGIVVGLLARGSPWGTLPAALLISALHQGGGLMQAVLGVPSQLVLFTQGAVVVLVAISDPLISRLRSKRADAREASGAALVVEPSGAVVGS
ncbi:MAG: ABC transporter permease [Acidimicrobiia bacterium]